MQCAIYNVGIVHWDEISSIFAPQSVCKCCLLISSLFHTGDNHLILQWWWWWWCSLCSWWWWWSWSKIVWSIKDIKSDEMIHRWRSICSMINKAVVAVLLIFLWSINIDLIDSDWGYSRQSIFWLGIFKTINILVRCLPVQEGWDASRILVWRINIWEWSKLCGGDKKNPLKCCWMGWWKLWYINVQ